MRYNSALFCKPLGMFLLFLEERFRYKQRKIGVDMASRLEHIVQRPLHFFPDRITIGLYDHTAAHGAVFSQTRSLDDLVVPLGIIFRTFRKGFAHIVALSFTLQK